MWWSRSEKRSTVREALTRSGAVFDSLCRLRREWWRKQSKCGSQLSRTLRAPSWIKDLCGGKGGWRDKVRADSKETLKLLGSYRQVPWKHRLENGQCQGWQACGIKSNPGWEVLLDIHWWLLDWTFVLFLAKFWTVENLKEN